MIPLEDSNEKSPLMTLQLSSILIAVSTLLVAYLSASLLGSLAGNYLISNQHKRTVNTALESSQFSLEVTKTATKGIFLRNIFDSNNAALPEEKFASDLRKKEAEDKRRENQNKKAITIDDLSNAVKTSLSYKLLGTIDTGNPKLGLAILSLGGKNTNSYFVGDTINKIAKLLGIFREKIVFLHNGNLEYLEVLRKEKKRGRRRHRRKKGSGSRPAGSGRKATPKRFADNSDEIVRKDGFERTGDKVRITTKFRDRFLNEKLGEALRGAKAMPAMQRGKIVGWKMTRIKPGSIYKDLGIRENDVIEEINGQRLNDASKAVSFLQSLRDENHISIKLRRNGASKTLDVNMQ